VLFERAEATATLPIVTIAADPNPNPNPNPNPEPATQTIDALGDASRLPRRILAEAVSVAMRLEAGLGGVGVSEVTLRPPTSPARQPELVMFSSDGRLVVRLGWGGWDDKITAFERVVEHARASGFFGDEPPAGQLDVRDPELVVAHWASEGTA
jgi:hypothetical protein